MYVWVLFQWISRGDATTLLLSHSQYVRVYSMWMSRGGGRGAQPSKQTKIVYL